MVTGLASPALVRLVAKFARSPAAVTFLLFRLVLVAVPIR
jgi:hypothetical protein